MSELDYWLIGTGASAEPDGVDPIDAFFANSPVAEATGPPLLPSGSPMAAVRESRKLDRAGRTSAGRDGAWVYHFCQALLADSRFATLVVSHRLILLVGALKHSDMNGALWPKKETWARAAGEKPKTVQRAVEAAEAHGLIKREAHARPDGRQGSNTYRFDPKLVAIATANANVVVAVQP